jgi:hypothetical protein
LGSDGAVKSRSQIHKRAMQDERPTCNCPVCQSTARFCSTGSGGMRYDCPRCGEFELTGSLVAQLPSELNHGVHRRALMSHNIRRMGQANAKPPLIDTYNVESFWRSERLPTPQRQADDLILWVGDNQPAPDEYIPCEVPFLSAWVGTSLKPSTTSSGDLHWLCTYLADAKLMEGRPKTQSTWLMRLTMRGWEKFAELKRQGAASSQAFVAMWFDDTTEEAWTNGLQKGIAASGYEPLRINLKEHVNKICDEIIAEIRRSRFVVADYTGHRGGVYYEAGFASGLGLTVIPTCRKDKVNKLHFDVRQYNCIDWETPAELGSGPIKSGINCQGPSLSE